MNIQTFRAQIRSDEGLSLHAYQDTLGNWTIGYGHLLSAQCADITEEVAETLLDIDIENLCKQLLKLDWWLRLDQVRQGVIANMAFNLGVPRLLEFKKMIAALKQGDYAQASKEMLTSLWASQVPARAKRLAAEMRDA